MESQRILLLHINNFLLSIIYFDLFLGLDYPPFHAHPFRRSCASRNVDKWMVRAIPITPLPPPRPAQIFYSGDIKDNFTLGQSTPYPFRGKNSSGEPLTVKPFVSLKD